MIFYTNSGYITAVIKYMYVAYKMHIERSFTVVMGLYIGEA